MIDDKQKRRVALTAITISTLAIWLGVLPWIARRPAMQQHLSELERHGIDGGAMFYTELPMMDRLLEKLER